MFEDRRDAGRKLGAWLREREVRAAIVIGLPRGGVPVAAEVARALGLPLDVVLVRKLGIPAQPEVAMGAIGEGGVRVLDDEVRRHAGVTLDEVAAVEADEREVIAARSSALRGTRARLDLSGQRVLIVDDGIATGATASAACQVARALGAEHVIVAAPVGGRDASRSVIGAEEVLCLAQPARFRAVGEHYRRFDQTTDAEVVAALTGQDRPSPPHAV